MNLYNFRSEIPKNPFAPKYNYFFCSENCFDLLDIKKITFIVLKKEKEILSKYPPTKKTSIDGYTNLGKNSLTSRYSHYNIFDWDEIKVLNLKSVILDTHSKFLKELGYSMPSKIDLKGWANVMRKDEKIDSHIHSVNSNSYLSGHVNIQVDNTSTFYVNPVNVLNEPTVVEIKNNVGEITLFPSCMPHYTNKQTTDKERITIAFDLFCEYK